MADSSLHQAEVIKDHAPIPRLSCLEALKERRGDVKCFTPALLITHGGLHIDPAQDFIARAPASADKQPFCVELPPSAPPFFAGLPTTVLDGKAIDWSRRLYAIDSSRADLCFRFLGGIGISGPDNYFASSVAYELNIPDPLSINPHNLIPVHIFGVLSNNRITYLAPAGYNAPTVRTIAAADRFKAEFGLAVDEDLGTEFRKLRGDT